MAQTSDFIIDNGTGAEVRRDINDALMSLATLNSGATAPSNPVEWMLWLDTTQTTINIYIDDEWNPILQANASTSFPSGTRMIFNQASPPTGWALDEAAAFSDAVLRVVTGTGGGTGGSALFNTWLTGHAHYSTQTPPVQYAPGTNSFSMPTQGSPSTSPKYTDVIIGVKS